VLSVGETTGASIFPQHVRTACFALQPTRAIDCACCATDSSAKDRLSKGGIVRPLARKKDADRKNSLLDGCPCVLKHCLLSNQRPTTPAQQANSDYAAAYDLEATRKRPDYRPLSCKLGKRYQMIRLYHKPVRSAADQTHFCRPLAMKNHQCRRAALAGLNHDGANRLCAFAGAVLNNMAFRRN
jgi:hypothetical protein